MRGSKHRARDPHRLMAVTCMVFYGGLFLLALAWALLMLVPVLEKTPLPLALLPARSYSLPKKPPNRARRAKR